MGRAVPPNVTTVIVICGGVELGGEVVVPRRLPMATNGSQAKEWVGPVDAKRVVVHERALILHLPLPKRG
jgi:hypothetical protein